MSDGANSWDERYRRGEHATLEPSRVLRRAVELFRHQRDAEEPSSHPHAAQRPRALDLACGAGRHALYLAAEGFRVTAVDASRVGVDLMLRRAAERGLELEARVADLERHEFLIEPEAYDLICDFYYLQRDLFDEMRAGLRPGGLFAAAIHTTDERPGVRPMNPDFLLRPGELAAAFRDWHILHYHETREDDRDPGEHTRHTAELIARRP
ncbi:MAG TPA: methyltransferase domain-containing protein [Pyrinomonadaceae bacterium]|nr:methyltransferase domain-containing protein [Pyrinomonadaceae bacterium]